MKNQLPPFPVDDATLGMLEAALNPRAHGDPDATSSGIWPLLTMLSQMGGSDTQAVEEVLDEGDPSVPGLAGASIVMMRDQHYHDNDVIAALVAEVRRLRGLHNAMFAASAPAGVPVRAFYRRYRNPSDKRAAAVRRLHIVNEEGDVPGRQGMCGRSAAEHKATFPMFLNPMPAAPPAGLVWCPPCIGLLAAESDFIGAFAGELATRKTS